MELLLLESDQNLQTRVTRQLLRWNEAARRHPRRVIATVCALLGGFAVTAFGIAPMAPDAADLPQRLVTESVPLTGLEQQLDALSQHNLSLIRSDVTRASDSVDVLFRRMGVVDATAAVFIRNDRIARRLIEGRAGKMVQVETDQDGSLRSLVARYPAHDTAQLRSHFTRLTLRKVDGRWHSLIETAALVPQVRLGSGAIRSSLFAATDEARLPDAIATQMVDIFSGDIDFHRQLRKGDAFSVVFEALTADDQPITWVEGTGRILAAAFTNNGKTHQALWFTDASGRGGYFGFDGQSRKRAFLASPMEFSRVTSGFAMRMHPILQTWRAHNGVDYAAPKGTPVRAVGEGVVEFAGWQNGYGNVVQLKHGGDKATVYAHLSKIDVRKGQHVEQGQHVGQVGATGWATGPHLHFEFRVNGQFEDPLKIARAAETVVVDAAAKPRFNALATNVRGQLDAAGTMTGYRGDAE